ncbi:unnamed protein product [Linum trigynum]|uniref:Uncharacterized protein n=1 Tax=Linum trigynum TaxID=586398 RepID=A0AAV2ETV0_9ROSI
MAMQLRADSNMEEVQVEVEKARRESDVIMQLLTSMQEEQRRLATALGLGGGDRGEVEATRSSPAVAAGPRAGTGGGSAATFPVASGAATGL